MKLLLVSNCQTNGLERCINFLAPHVHLTALSENQFPKAYHEKKVDINAYDRIVGTPFLFKYIEGKTAITDPGRVVPFNPIFFDAFHPDICRLRIDKTFLQSKMGNLHSVIIVAACFCGYPPDRIIYL